jgi:hypothetical protein
MINDGSNAKFEAALDNWSLYSVKSQNYQVKSVNNRKKAIFAFITY